MLTDQICIPLGDGWWLEPPTDQELDVARSAEPTLSSIAYLMRGEKCVASVRTLAHKYPWPGRFDPAYLTN